MGSEAPAFTHTTQPPKFQLEQTAPSLPSLFTSPPSSLILLLHDSHLSPQLSPLHRRCIRGSSHPHSSSNANIPRVLRPQTARRPRPTDQTRRIPRPSPPRTEPHVPAQSGLRRHPHRPRHVPLLFHRHPLVAQRTPPRAHHPAHGTTHPHLPRIRRIPHARIAPLLRRSPRLAGRRNPLPTHRRLARRSRSPHRPYRHRRAPALHLLRSFPRRRAGLRSRLRRSHHDRLQGRQIPPRT